MIHQNFDILVKRILFHLNRPISELVGKCHPLGSFEQMEAIHIASTPAELYNAVLVDTPLAPFFESCINEQVSLVLRGVVLVVRLI